MENRGETAMDQQQAYQQTIDECNAECRRCMRDYQKSGIEFNPRVCSLCSNGHILHKALMHISEDEVKRGMQDWNSAKLQDLYQA